MVLIEAPSFTKYVHSYLNDEQFAALQRFLVANPEAGETIEGTGGFRKVRWADPRRSKGKRGGLRLIYFHFERDDQIWLMMLYGKDEADDLTADQKRSLKAAINLELRERSEVRGRKPKRHR